MQHARLLMNFFLHVVPIVTFIDIVATELNFDRRADDGFIGHVPDADAAPGDLHEVTFFQKDEAIGDRSQRQRIGSNEVFAYAFADHQRATHAGGDDTIRFIPGNDADGVSAFEPLNRLANGFQQRAGFRRNSDRRDGR